MPQYVMVRVVDVTDELAVQMSTWTDQMWMVRDHGAETFQAEDAYDRVDVAGAIVLAAQGQAEAAATVLRNEQTRDVAKDHHPQKVSTA